MRIEPASFAQFQQAVNGRWIEIDSDVGSVALQLQEIARDRGIELHLRLSETTGIFKVVQLIDGEEQLVTSATEVGQDLVDTVRKVTSPSYDLFAEVERLDHEKDRRFNQEQSEKVGDAAERLAHALRVDLNEQKVF